MRTKVTLVLVFLNVALFFFIFKFERNWRTESARMEDRRRVLGAEAANIQSLEISGSGIAQPINLSKRGDRWYLSKPFSWPANGFAVSRIVNDLQLLEHKAVFNVADLAQSGRSLADYGLDKPRLTVAFSSATVPDKSGASAAAPSLLRVGLDTPDLSGLYVLSNDGERIHVVSRSFAQSLTQTTEQLRDDAIFSVPEFEVRYFILQMQSANITRIRHEGERWSIEVPINARAGTAVTRTAIQELNALKVKRFVDNPPPNAVPDSGAIKVQLEGNGRTEIVTIGSPVSPPDAAPGTVPPAVQDYYARKDSRPDTENASPVLIVAIKAALMDTLRGAQVALRDRRVLEFDPATVTALAITSPNAPEFKLQRLESASAAAASWQIVRPSASQGPQQSADGKVVQDLLDRLVRLEALEFASDAPQRADLESWGFNRPERTLTLTIAGEPNKPRKLELGLSADRRHVYARAGTDYVYEVKDEILRDISAAAGDYRDRILRQLPAGARVTGIRITDIASGAILHEQTFDLAPSADAPSSAPAAAPAVAPTAMPVPDLPSQLRVLRARRFLPEAFNPERVAVDGEERPWKYRLDVTVRAEGGAAGPTTDLTQILVSERIGGTMQLAGSQSFGAVWELEQAFIDALGRIVEAPKTPAPPGN